MPVFNDAVLQQFTEQPNSGEIDIGADGVMTVERAWKANYNLILQYIPAPGDPDPLGTNTKCANVKVSRFATGDGGKPIGLLRCTYIGFFVMPPNEYEWTTLRIDRPIEMHPKFNDTSKFPGVPPANLSPGQTPSATPEAGCKLWDYDKYGFVHFLKFKDVGSATDTKFRGITDFMAGGGQWKVVDYSLTPDAHATDNFKIDTPANPGGWNIPSNSGPGGLPTYLKIQHDCMNILKGRSNLYRRTRCWLWNPLGWLHEVYD